MGPKPHAQTHVLVTVHNISACLIDYIGTGPELNNIIKQLEQQLLWQMDLWGQQVPGPHFVAKYVIVL